MRIISKFKDYYDITMQHGFDSEVVYIRNQTECPYNLKDIKLYEIYQYCLDKFKLHSYYISHDAFFNFNIQHKSKRHPNYYIYSYVKPIYIGFCGVIYKLLSINIKHEFFIYSFEDMKKLYDNKNIIIDDKIDWKLFFEPLEDDSIFVKIENPIWSAQIRTTSPFITINPRLSNYEFYKIFNSYNAYQQIYRYLCSVLCKNKLTVTDISDENKIHKHGFDKWSFKKKFDNRNRKRKRK